MSRADAAGEGGVGSEHDRNHRLPGSRSRGRRAKEGRTTRFRMRWGTLNLLSQVGAADHTRDTSRGRAAPGSVRVGSRPHHAPGNRWPSRAVIVARHPGRFNAARAANGLRFMYTRLGLHSRIGRRQSPGIVGVLTGMHHWSGHGSVS